jgi:outer membrane protein TolC
MLSDLLDRRRNVLETIRLKSDKLAVLDRQLTVAETQIQTGQADVAKVFEVKVQRHQLESSIRQARADLRVTEYQVASELGLFSLPSENGTDQ